MTFQALDFTNYSQSMMIGAVVVSLVVWILSFAILNLSQSKDKTDAEANIALVVALGFGIMCGLGTAVIVNSQGWDAYGKNQVVASENIMKKYDVKEVLWQDPQTKAIPSIGKESKQNRELVIKTNDDKKYVFIYSADQKTSEPTLEDTASQSGDTSENRVSASSLLKNK